MGTWTCWGAAASQLYRQPTKRGLRLETQVRISNARLASLRLTPGFAKRYRLTRGGKGSERTARELVKEFYKSPSLRSRIARRRHEDSAQTQGLHHRPYARMDFLLERKTPKPYRRNPHYRGEMRRQRNSNADTNSHRGLSPSARLTS